jgi:excisionase family DNA binding protein
MSQTIQKDYLSLTEMAEHLGLSRRTLERYVKQHLVEVIRLGRTIRVPMYEVERIATDSMMPKEK